MQALVGYIDGMEEKLSQMMEEMKDMRLEVEKLHDKGIGPGAPSLWRRRREKSVREKPWSPRPVQTSFPLPGAWWRPYRKRDATPCAMRCRRCVSPPFSPGWSAAFPTQARRWSSVPESWM